MSLSLAQFNDATVASRVQAIENVYLNAPWIAEQAALCAPFASLAALKWAMVEAVSRADAAAKLALINSYDVLADFDAGNPEVQAQIDSLGQTYRERFGFAFVLALQGPRGTGLSAQEVLQTIQRRMRNPVDFEQSEALRHIHRMAELTLNRLFDDQPNLGNDVWDWCEALAEHSEPGYRERGELTVTYLTDAHRACAKQIADWMREKCQFDEVDIDAVGNVVGVYFGQDRDAPRLLTGSHYDTVRNGGKYDGRLGILVPMACVRELARQGKRLPFGIEVVAFAEEEGQRFKAVFLGSGALIGQFDPKWLDETDADGVTMRAAMQHAGLDIEQIAQIKRDPQDYLGFVEVHIEQGPVLTQRDLPLGVVTSINGGVRLMGEVIGMASHAGTTPMGMRRDAAAAVAELILYAQKRAAEVPDVVATVGMLEVPNGSINVVPGACRFSLDIRATTDVVRDACVADVREQLGVICSERGLTYELREFMRVSAAPSDALWQQRWERAISELGLPVFTMPSGAGHDAMKLHHVMPQAMLFVRGINNGISHNPLEMTTSDDIELCVQAFDRLLLQIASKS